MDESVSNYPSKDLDDKYSNSNSYHNRPKMSYQYKVDTNLNPSKIKKITGFTISLLAIYLLIFNFFQISFTNIDFTFLREFIDEVPLQTIIVIVSTAIISINKYNIVLKSYNISFRPITLTWETSISRKILVSSSIDERISTFLLNNKKMTWTTFIDLPTDEIKLVIGKSRRLIPYRPSSIDSILQGVLVSYDIITETTSFPKIKLSSYRLVHAEVLLVSLNQIYYQINDMIKSSSQNIKIVSIVKFKHFNYDPLRKKHIPVYEVRLGFAAKDYTALSYLLETSGIKATFPSKYNRKSTKLKVDALKAYNLMKLPSRDYGATSQISRIDAPKMNFSPKLVFGSLLKYGHPYEEFGIPISDLSHGGIIAGAIGTGKTTLRLHLMRLAISSGVRVIDFDLKGDAASKASLANNAIVAIPNRNFHLNPFICPMGFESKQYANILLQSFVETIPDGEALTPPQLNLLTSTIVKTVEEGGNARQFFANFLILANLEKEIIDNKQDATAQALMVRFNWMQTTLADIFWKNGSSLLYTDYTDHSLIFDLSELVYTATNSQIRFLINLIMARIMPTIQHTGDSTLKQLVFVDEAHILMPRRASLQEMSKLEETIATLRYKGVAVIAVGISSFSMSSVLLDVGFVAQFRTESEGLIRALAISENEGLLPELPLYTAVVKTNSMGTGPVIIKINKFKDIKTKSITLRRQLPTLGTFALDFKNIWQSRLDGLLLEFETLTPYKIKELRSLARVFVDEQVKIKGIDHNQLHDIILFANKELERQILIKTASLLCGTHPQQYLIQILRYSLLNSIILLKHDPKLNLIRKNLGKIIEDGINYIQSISKELNQNDYMPKFTGLERYIRLITNGEVLNEEEERSFFTLTASRIDHLLKKLLGFNQKTHQKTRKLISMAEKQEMITEEGACHLLSFLNHRNQQLHGQMEKMPVQIDIVILAAEVILNLQLRLNHQLQDTETVFQLFSEDNLEEDSD